MKYIYFVVLFLKLVFSQYIGENCRLNDGSRGYCQLIHNCTTTLNDLKSGINPVHCGKEPIVCCSRAQKKIEQKSVQKCKEYSAMLSQKSRVNVRHVIGGQPSKPQEFQHMAAVGYGKEDNKIWMCGGTLISNQFVLTAAHCLSSRQFGAVKWVRLGDLDVNSANDDAEPQDFQVISSIRHPEYKTTAKYNDIALLKLDRKVKFSSYVHPACLHTNFNLETNTLTAIGWGSLKFGGKKSGNLMKVELDVFAEDACTSVYQPDRTLSRGIHFERQICAGGKYGVRDTCEGDSGGPLLVKMSQPHGMYEVVGITSFGKPCGNPNIPGVYTRVSYYVPWIENVVWP